MSATVVRVRSLTPRTGPLTSGGLRCGTWRIEKTRGRLSPEHSGMEENLKHPVDVHVGQRLRQRRWLAGMTQQQLAEMVGIRFQQIQKYETGMNRVSASRLWEIGCALEVPVAYFFEGLSKSDNDEPGRAPGDLINDREALELVRTYYAIPEAQRKRLFDLARVLTEAA